MKPANGSAQGYSIIERRPPLTERQKQLMLLVFIRHEKTFKLVRDRITPAHFNEYERGYALVWQAVVECHARAGVLPNEEALLAEVERLVEAETNEMSAEEVAKLDQFIMSVYLVPTKQLQPEIALQFCQTFLQDRLVDRVRDTLREGRDTPTEIYALFARAAEEASQLQTIESSVVEAPFAADWKPQPMKKVTTNLPFFDTLLNGGHVAKEAYGLMGPIGSCKTTIGIMLSVAGAAIEQERWRQARNRQAKIGLWYYAQYEEAIEPDILMRAISYAGQINRSTMEDFDLTRLSVGEDQSTLKPYERELFKTQLASGQLQLGEKERYEEAIRQLRANWRPIDMSGSDPAYPTRGSGLVTELAALITGDIANRPQAYVAGIVIDHVSAACERYIAKNNKDHGELRHVVSKFPLHAKRELAGHLECPVWLLHQVSGDANSRSPATLLHHTDAAESKSFAEFLNVCFTVGNQNSEGLCTLALRKGRRLKQREEIIIQIDGGLNRVLDVDACYMRDHNRIVPRADRDRIVDAEAYSGTVGSSMRRAGL